QLFGGFAEGFRSLRPYVWREFDDRLLEIPVTTMPFFKTPIHLSYLLYLSQYSHRLAVAYFESALALCRVTRVEPSILLHPLDFLGKDDDQDLAFFPAMNVCGAEKLQMAAGFIDRLAASFTVVPMREHAAAVRARLGVRTHATTAPSAAVGG